MGSSECEGLHSSFLMYQNGPAQRMLGLCILDLIFRFHKLANLMQGTRNPFVALFQSKCVSGTGKVAAFVSRSTRGMRAVMQNPPNSLAFEMPLAPAGSSDACSERHTKELLELGQVRRQAKFV